MTHTWHQWWGTGFWGARHTPWELIWVGVQAFSLRNWMLLGKLRNFYHLPRNCSNSYPTKLWRLDNINTRRTAGTAWSSYILHKWEFSPFLHGLATTSYIWAEDTLNYTVSTNILLCLQICISCFPPENIANPKSSYIWTIIPRFSIPSNATFSTISDPGPHFHRITAISLSLCRAQPLYV